MAKTINLLLTALSAENTEYLVTCNDNGVTKKLPFGLMSDQILQRIPTSYSLIAVIGSNAQYNSIYYNNYQYIDAGGAYTKSYTAVANCIVLYHLRWDCDGDDGIKLQLLNNSKVVAEIPLFSEYEANGNPYLNVNGTIPLGAGMTIRFAPIESDTNKNNFNTRTGNHMNLLVATI